MRPRGAGLPILVLLGTLTGTVALGAEIPDYPPARLFAQQMMQGIGAQVTDCSAEIAKEVENRRMSALCARFEGTFDSFEVRWGLQLLLNEPGERDTVVVAGVEVEAQTEWVAKGRVHDRIYRVGRLAVGVRFTSGDVLLVW
jgi:hypothetical protein